MTPEVLTDTNTPPPFGGRTGLTVPRLQARELPKVTQLITSKAKSPEGVQVLTSQSEPLLTPNIITLIEKYIYIIQICPDTHS